MGETNPLHVRIDVDENEAPRVNIGAKAKVSPRGAAETQVDATFVPLMAPFSGEVVIAEDGTQIAVE